MAAAGLPLPGSAQDAAAPPERIDILIPQQDYDFLQKAGVKAIFGPGTNIPEAAQDILRLIREARVETV